MCHSRVFGLRIACSRLSVSGEDRKKQRGTRRRAGSGGERGRPLSPPDPARRLVPRCFFRSSPLTESLEQASLRMVYPTSRVSSIFLDQSGRGRDSASAFDISYWACSKLKCNRASPSLTLRTKFGNWQHYALARSPARFPRVFRSTWLPRRAVQSRICAVFTARQKHR